MSLRFNEAKTAQAAARLLSLRGGRMHYMKLIKLLYLVDREALLRWGRPVTRDRYVSMDKGPVLSRTLDLINEGDEPGTHGAWSECISAPEGYEVTLKRDPPPDDDLSQAECGLIDEVFKRYGSMNRWDIVKLLHDLPEWRDPNGSRIPITYGDIFAAGGKSPSETAAMEEELDSLRLAESLVPSRL